MKAKDQFIGWEATPQNKVRYQIQRERQVTCFGNPGYVMEWDVIREYDTADERDAEFDRLMGSDFEHRYQTFDYDPRRNRIMFGAVA